MDYDDFDEIYNDMMNIVKTRLTIQEKTIDYMFENITCTPNFLYNEFCRMHKNELIKYRERHLRRLIEDI
jgi:hypothetical protein